MPGGFEARALAALNLRAQLPLPGLAGIPTLASLVSPPPLLIAAFSQADHRSTQVPGNGSRGFERQALTAFAPQPSGRRACRPTVVASRLVAYTSESVAYSVDHARTCSGGTRA